MKNYADGTRVIVTKIASKRQYTKNDPLFGLDGTVVTDVELLLNNDLCDIVLDDCSVGIHFDVNDILVHFPVLDFCYWLSEGEYEIFTED